IQQVVSSEATPPRALRPELRISEAIERVVMKAMAKSVDERYASMDALTADLQHVVEGAAVDAPVQKPPRRPARPRMGLGMAAAGGRAGTALLLAIARFARAPGAAQQPAPVPPPAVVKAPPPPEAPRSIVLHVETDPPGAEIRQGSRVFGR